MEASAEREDQFATIEEDVEKMVGERIAKTLDAADKGGWLAAKVPVWTGDVVESVLKELMGLQKPFKYAVSAVIMQRNGAGMTSASSCYWDAGAYPFRAALDARPSQSCVSKLFYAVSSNALTTQIRMDR